MVSELSKITFILSVVAVFLSCSRGADRPLLIGAASSLSNVMNELAVEFKNNHQMEIKITYAASGIINTQIQEGAPIDIFVSADTKYLDELEQSGKILKSIIMCRNKLVFATGSHMSGSAGQLLPTNGKIKKIGIGNPDYSPAGKYAVELLKESELYSLVENKLIYGSNVRQVLSWLENGDVDAAYIYKTDSLLLENIDIAGEWGYISGKSIDYPTMIIRSVKPNKASYDFIKFLGSARAKEILNKFGFGE